MTDKTADTKLEKFVQSEIEVLSPLMAKSNMLKIQADKVEITDKESYVDAKTTRRELVSHRNTVKDLRLTFTRKLDQVKGLFIEKQDEVLAPAIEAEAGLKGKIVDWEDEQKRLKEAEDARIQAILDKLTMPTFDLKVVTRDELVRAQAALKMELGLLDQKDKNKKAVKDHVAAQRNDISKSLGFVDERDRQAAEAQQLAAERAKLDADKKAHDDKVAADAAKASEKQTPPTSISESAKESSTVDKGSSDDQVDYNFEIERDLGTECLTEATKTLGDRLSEIEGQQLEGEKFDEWKSETVDQIYQVIEKHR